MEKGKLTAVFSTGLSLLAGCNLQERAFNETQLRYNPKEQIASIWAVDYDGIKEVVLSDGNTVLARDPLSWTYIKNPHAVSVSLTNGVNRDRYLDESIKSDLLDGEYIVRIHDIKGNYFEKHFTKKQGKVTHP